MIQLEKMTFGSFLTEINNELANGKKHYLISWTEKVEPFSPVAIHQKAKESGKDRTFWMNNTHDFTIVGIGVTEKIIAEENRFNTLQQKWNDVVHKATIHDPYQKVGTGLIALGGMT